MRCPECGSLGLWNPYGRWWKDRQVRRWLCKWCGLYDGVDGRFWAVMDRARGCWVLPVEVERESWVDYEQRVKSGELTTPREIARKEGFGR
jgi:hypothetical protein